MPINGKFSHVGPGLGEGGGVLQKASRHWGPAFDMDILTFIAWPVDMLASHHPLYCSIQVNISLAWSKHILWPMGTCILPPIYASLLFDWFTLFYWFIYFLFSGENRVAEFDCVCVLLTQPTATCLLTVVDHCTTPPPLLISQPTSSSSSMFLDTLHHLLAPPQHLCLVSTNNSMKELERTHDLKAKPGK